jgi:hypothetical protein
MAPKKGKKKAAAAKDGATVTLAKLVGQKGWVTRYQTQLTAAIAAEAKNGSAANKTKVKALRIKLDASEAKVAQSQAILDGVPAAAAPSAAAAAAAPPAAPPAAKPVAAKPTASSDSGPPSNSGNDNDGDGDNNGASTGDAAAASDGDDGGDGNAPVDDDEAVGNDDAASDNNAEEGEAEDEAEEKAEDREEGEVNDDDDGNDGDDNGGGDNDGDGDGGSGGSPSPSDDGEDDGDNLTFDTKRGMEVFRAFQIASIDNHAMKNKNEKKTAAFNDHYADFSWEVFDSGLDVVIAELADQGVIINLVNRPANMTKGELNSHRNAAWTMASFALGLNKRDQVFKDDDLCFGVGPDGSVLTSASEMNNILKKKKFENGIFHYDWEAKLQLNGAKAKVKPKAPPKAKPAALAPTSPAKASPPPLPAGPAKASPSPTPTSSEKAKSSTAQARPVFGGALDFLNNVTDDDPADQLVTSPAGGDSLAARLMAAVTAPMTAEDPLFDLAAVQQAIRDLLQGKKTPGVVPSIEPNDNDAAAPLKGGSKAASRGSPKSPTRRPSKAPSQCASAAPEGNVTRTGSRSRSAPAAAEGKCGAAGRLAGGGRAHRVQKCRLASDGKPRQRARLSNMLSTLGATTRAAAKRQVAPKARQKGERNTKALIAQAREYMRRLRQENPAERRRRSPSPCRSLGPRSTDNAAEDDDDMSEILEGLEKAKAEVNKLKAGISEQSEASEELYNLLGEIDDVIISVSASNDTIHSGVDDLEGAMMVLPMVARVMHQVIHFKEKVMGKAKKRSLPVADHPVKRTKTS